VTSPVADNTPRRRLNTAHWPLNTAYWLLITALGLPLITPLLRWTAVACTHDGHLHYHRVAAMAHAWGNGIYLTRWLPDLAFGYGYPFFVYREAAPLYAVLLPHLAGLPLPAASNLFYALTILAAGVFMALWVRDLLGPRAAVVSAVAYMAAPYVLIDALVRGNAPESLALPLLPLLLWAGRRWVVFGSVRAFLVGALGLALLSFSHNISTFIFAPTLGVYLVVVGWFSGERGPDGRPAHAPPALQRAALLIALGLGLAFFYTGGAVLEMDQVTLERSTTTRNNDWRYNFATVGEILSPVAPEDPALLNPPLRLRLGWAPLLLAALGATGLLWLRGTDGRTREQRLHIWLMLAGAAVYLFMALPISRPVWGALPLIDFVQFPWRFVGRAALPVAFLAGVAFADRRPPTDQRPTTNDQPRTTNATRHSRRSAVGHRWSAVGPMLAIALLFLEAVPNLYPRYCQEEPFPTIMTVHAYERATGLVGVDPEGSYFPRTVAERPTGSPLEADFAAGRTPQRFDATTLPAGATLRDVVYSCRGVTLTVASPQPFTARYLSFDFPGWSARVDGARVPITAEDPTGLITFAVPAGEHRVEVRWGATPLRLGLVALSALAALGVVVVVSGGWRAGSLVLRERVGERALKRRGAGQQGSGGDAESAASDATWSGRQLPTNDQRPTTTLPRRDLIALAVLALALLGAKLVFDRVETPLRRAGAPPVAAAGGLAGGELRFDGFNLSRATVAAGATFDIDLAWTALAPPGVDYQSDVWLVGPDGLIWSVKGTERPRVFEDAPPTRQWQPGEWAWDSREVAVLSGAPPGRYDIVLTLFDKATLQPVTLTDAGGAAVGPAAVIGTITIINPTAPPDFAPQYPLAAAVAPGLNLLGYNQDRTAAVPGERLLLTLFWECDEPALCERFTVRLEDDAGQTAQTWQLPIVREDFAADEWPAHGRLREQYQLQLPAALETGQYHFVVGDGVALEPIQVTAPERTFAPPALSLELNAPFAAADGQLIATLVGLAEPSPQPSPEGRGSALPCSPAPLLPCPIPLIWRAEAETLTDYRVFVHLVDATGAIVAQSDAAPANWTRPTTGWLPGEYVLDTHTLALPATLPDGPLSLRVGLYDPDTGQRLITGAADFAVIDP